jgi:two-component system, OmpR family, aerobic respiration control sensor histidine kinase ArcB
VTPDKPDSPIESETARINSQNRFSLLSHDLRSALTDILGGLRLVDANRLDSETKAHFERMNVSVQSLARLLDKSLDDNSSGNDTNLTHATNINLVDFIDDIRKRWQGRATDNGIEFEVTLMPSLPAIITLDRVSLDRVLANLLGNSIKFTDTGKVEIQVECRPDKSLCFTVRDDGIGFSDQALAKLYEYQGRPQNTQKPGTGLGLYIAKELSTVLGASLNIFNRAEKGAEAQLTIPHDVWFDRSLRRENQPQQPVQDQHVDLTGLRILLAEDNKTNQLVATQMLRSMGAEFAVASDGLEALTLLENERFDLALLDIEMPRMTGLELIKAVRAKPSPLCDMPLVALTAYVMREHRERIFSAGADGIIAKPVMSIAELGLAILDHLSDNGPHMGGINPAKPHSSLPEGTIVDLSVFDALVDTIGPDSLLELLTKLQADTDSVAEGLGRGRQNLDLAEIRSQTHILVSVAGAIGAKPLQLIAQRLNTAANRQDATVVDDLCRECLTGLKALQGFITEQQDKAAQLT